MFILGLRKLTKSQSSHCKLLSLAGIASAFLLYFVWHITFYLSVPQIVLAFSATAFSISAPSACKSCNCRPAELGYWLKRFGSRLQCKYLGVQMLPPFGGLGGCRRSKSGKGLGTLFACLDHFPVRCTTCFRDDTQMQFCTQSVTVSAVRQKPKHLMFPLVNVNMQPSLYHCVADLFAAYGRETWPHTLKNLWNFWVTYCTVWMYIDSWYFVSRIWWRRWWYCGRV